jgi:hypothetical protein
MDVFTFLLATYAWLTPYDADDIESDIIMAIEVEGTLDTLDFNQTARLLAVFGKEETGFQNLSGDGGNSIGVLQVNKFFLKEWTVKEVLADRSIGFQIGLRTMQDAVQKCGTLRRGLQQYASGRCSGAQKLITHRCKVAAVPCP